MLSSVVVHSAGPFSFQNILFASLCVPGALSSSVSVVLSFVVLAVVLCFWQEFATFATLAAWFSIPACPHESKFNALKIIFPRQPLFFSLSFFICLKKQLSFANFYIICTRRKLGLYCSRLCFANVANWMSVLWNSGFFSCGAIKLIHLPVSYCHWFCSPLDGALKSSSGHTVKRCPPLVSHPGSVAFDSAPWLWSGSQPHMYFH